MEEMMPHRRGHLALEPGTKLIALFDVQKQALGSHIYLNFHTCCKGRVKQPHYLMEMDVFGQLLRSL